MRSRTRWPLSTRKQSYRNEASERPRRKEWGGWIVAILVALSALLETLAEGFSVLAWIAENPVVAAAIFGLLGTVIGGILGLLAPWVKDRMATRAEAREEARKTAQQRRELIACWRRMVRGATIYCAANSKPDVYKYLLGQPEFHSLESHAHTSFRGGIRLIPALSVGHHLPAPLEDIVRAIDELEDAWGLRD